MGIEVWSWIILSLPLYKLASRHRNLCARYCILDKVINSMVDLSLKSNRLFFKWSRNFSHFVKILCAGRSPQFISFLIQFYPVRDYAIFLSTLIFIFSSLIHKRSANAISLSGFGTIILYELSQLPCVQHVQSIFLYFI